MGVLSRAAIGIARPVYRQFFERPLWWFLTKVKTFFMAEVSENLVTIQYKVQAIQHKMQTMQQEVQAIDQKVRVIESKVQTIEGKLGTIEGKLQAIEHKVRNVDNLETGAAQWDAIEQLLLAMFSQREWSGSDSDGGKAMLHHPASLSASEINQVNGTDTLR